jgi:hypothetical protein
LIVNGVFIVHAQGNSSPDFSWNNACYFNMDIGDSIYFNNTEIRLLKQENHFNQLKIGTETVWIKVSRRTPSVNIGNLLIFVADNKNVKALATNKEMHGLLTKDAMICITGKENPWLDPNQFVFPVSFNDGYLWSSEEDSYLFSYMNLEERKMKGYDSHAGIDFDLNDARGIEKHWLVAIENSVVAWIEDENLDRFGREACVLLESESQPGIYYLYKHLNNRKLKIKKGQKLLKGEPSGTVWGDEVWGNLHFAVIKSQKVPTRDECNSNLLNCFPQIFELYYNQPAGHSKYYSKGWIFFGKNRSQNGNQKNAAAFENYSGKGWNLGKWNVADKVDYASKGSEGNVRLRKKLFKGYAGECTNPNDWYDYEINVPNGVYRIRARIGDVILPSWQKLEFENIEAGVYSNKPGEYKWTSEKVVKVLDSKLTVRIYVDANNEKPAGISEIVFQQAY